MTRNKGLIPLALSLPILLFTGLILAWQALSPIAALAQPAAGITSPAPGSTLTGTVAGTAVIEPFQRYELFFKPAEAGDEAYTYFGGGTREVIDGQLGGWDASELAPGTYTLRMRVVHPDGSYSEHLVPNLTVAQQPTPTPVDEQPVAVIEAVPGEEGTKVGVAEQVVVTGAPAPAAPITVTLTGNDDDPAALRPFLRALLAGFSPNYTVVTATIGALPDDIPIDLTVPVTATVIGGVVLTGDFESSQIYFATEETADDLATALRGQLLDQGFTAPPQERIGDPSAVFLSSDLFPALPFLCSPDDEFLVSFGTALMAGAAEIASLNISPIRGFGGPCGEDPYQGGQDIGDMFAVLPSLVPPPQAQVRDIGGGQSSGDSDSFNISVQAEIETDLTAAELAAHYEAQLENEGWERLDDSQADALAWSAWSFVDEEENDWTATFYIVQQGGEEESFLATLWAETRQW